ncbi:MAG: hypothetical protein HOV80_31045 [Polyangiaceae bacterium]|nr:hypothetical protein [Polyangiaceae bacterium]
MQSPRKRRPAAFGSALLLVVVVVLACVQGARAPEVAPRGTLGLRELGGGEEETGPIAVVFASPKGKLTGPSEITVLFNKPLRELDTAGKEAPFPGKIDPPVPGTWQWAGTRAASFIPEREGGGGAARLPAATKFTVTIPKGTKALDGDALQEDYKFDFETERPEVVSTSPYRGSDRLERASTFRVSFNQPIDLAEVQKHVSLDVGGKAALATIEPAAKDDDRNFDIKPKGPLPLDTAVRLNVAQPIRGKEGPLPAERAERFDFRTVGPLVVSEIGCNDDAPQKKCSAASGISITFSNDVKVKDIKRAISIEPAVKFAWPGWMDDDTYTNSVWLSGGFQPGRSYTVRVATGFSDRHGQALKAGKSQRLAFGDLWPVARIGMTSGVVEPRTKNDVVVAHINASDLEIGTVPLTEDDILALENNELRFGDLEKRSGFKIKKSPSGRKNIREATNVSIDSILGGAKARGPFGVAIRYTSEGDPREERSFGQLTDLAITAKVSKAGSLVWVTRLSNAAPVANAEVRIRRPGGNAVKATTDAQGFATFSATDFTPNFEDEKAVIFVKAGEDQAYKPVGDNLYTWDFSPGEDPTIGMLFSDRKIYRPGDTAKMKGILRDPIDTGSKSPGAGKPITIEVQGPDGEKVATQQVTTTAFGTFSADVKVPSTTRLGSHYVTARIGDQQVASDDLEVAEYRPVEFKVAVESDRPSYIRGDTGKWTARGDYLFGAPMSGSDADLAVYREATSFRPPGLEGFVTSDDDYFRDLPDRTARESELVSNKSKLDPKGQATATASLALPGQRGPETIAAHLDIHDVSRQVVSGSTAAIVHPGEHYLGIDLETWFVPAKTKLSPKILAATPKGQKVNGVAIQVQLLKRVWTTAKQQSGAGSATTISTPVDTTIASCSLTSQASPVSCDLTPPDAGLYIVRATSQDARKNPIAAAQEVYVTGEGGTSFSSFASFEESDRTEVELVRNKDHYQVGDTAQILVKSPWKNADALVTIERSGVTEKRRIKVSGAAPTISVPITDKMRPNAFVSVLLVRGRTKQAPTSLDKPDLGAPAYKIGFANLVVDPESRRLAVSVKPDRTDYKPGEEVSVSLGVKDKSGKGAKSELTVYAVDEGVLSLVNYQTPDPIPVFGAPRPNHVATLEGRASLATLFDPLSGLGLDKGLAGGGGGEGAASGARKDFRASAYFNPAVVTDEQGNATVKFKLPDSLTTFRVMAVAVGQDDRFGSSDARIVTSKSLMARPALPRFLRAGDNFDASVIITSKGAAGGEAEVTAKLDGVTLKGAPTQKIRLAPGESVEVRFSAEAKKVGPAAFAFAVKTSDGSDSVYVERNVALPMAPEAVALYGSTSTESAERLGDMSAIRDDAGELTVTTASTALVGLDAGASQLLDYPYGCTEQLTSRLVPMVAMKDLANDFKFPLPKNIDDVVDKTIAKLVTHQRYDGGFGFWPDSPKAHPYATAYALWGLGEAKKKGYRVPEGVIDSATRHLLGLVQRGDSETMYYLGPFAMYVLAEQGKGDPGRISTLFESRKEMPAFSKGFLLSAMVKQKSDPGSIAVLTKELESLIRLDGPVVRIVENRGDAHLGYLDSETRTTAVILRALLQAKPDHPLAKQIVMGLLRERDGATWRSTQETAWSLLALGDYRRAQEKVVPNMTGRIFFGDDVVAEHSFEGRSLMAQMAQFPTAKLVAAGKTPLSFQVEGEGTLFYEARLRYVRKKLPSDTLDRGFYVEKRLRRVTHDTLDEALAVVPKETLSKFQGSDLILADIVVVTPKPRRFVAIDDPLPAGFEAIDMRLATSTRRPGTDMGYAAGNEDDEDGGYSAYYTKEIRDDRVLFFIDALPAGVYRYRYLARATSLGTFIVPPTKAEEMYAPEVFGRTPAGTITVNPK